MPGFFTHYLCGQKTLAKVSNTALKSIIEKNIQLYNLGTQGPDIFFYYGFWPWIDSENFHEVGETIHTQNINTFFSNALKYIAEREPSERDALISYLCGYACHYSLDCNTHPYIFYKTGFVLRDENYTPKYTYYHRSFETTIDFLIVSEMLKCKPFQIKANKLIKLSCIQSFAVGNMFRIVLKDTFGIEISIEQIERAIKDMGSALSILRDSTGLKKKFLSCIETSLGRYPLMSSMIHPLKLQDSLDYLNRQQAAWSLPWNKEAVNNTSFNEMFNNAISKAVDMYEAIYSCINGRLEREDILSTIGNNSFSTGIDCNIDLEFCFFDCIYE